MLTAAFDTSTSEASFTLLKEGKPVLSVSRECRRGASKLLPHIREEINCAGFDINEICKWYVGKGPGSFTGIRVGIAFVKGVCFGSGAAYAGINSGLAYLSPQLNENKVTVLHDGRKNEVICNSFVRSGDKWTEDGIEVVRIEDLKPEMFGGCFVTQMDIQLFPETVREDLAIIEKPDSALLLKSSDEFPVSVSEMEASCNPIYVRPAVFVKPAIRR